MDEEIFEDRYTPMVAKANKLFSQQLEFRGLFGDLLTSCDRTIACNCTAFALRKAAAERLGSGLTMIKVRSEICSLLENRAIVLSRKKPLEHTLE
jgi:hypothetical protein